jgi:DNA repair protein RadC
MSDNIHTGHRARLKQRFLKDGLTSFEGHQMLELLLYYGIPYKDTNKIAHSLINRFGSISGVFEAEYKDIIGINGIGDNTALLLKLIPEVTKMYAHDKWKDKPQLASTKKAGEYTKSLYIGKDYEVFYLICLDAQNRVNMAVPMFEGTINEAPVYPRLIVESALRHKANNVILSHNHPGGSVKASRADIEVTLKLKNVLNGISIKVIDHIIVAGQDYLSMAETGIVQF